MTTYRWIVTAMVLAAVAGGVTVVAAAASEPVMLRARVVAVEPALYVRIYYPGPHNAWNELTFERPRPPTAAAARLGRDGLAADRGQPAATPLIDDLMALLDEASEAPLERIVESSRHGDHYWLKPGVWSPAASVFNFGQFTVFRLEGLDPVRQERRPITTATLEFELSHQGQVLKTFTETTGEPAGRRQPEARLTIVLPVRRLGSTADPVTPDAEFIDGAFGILEYARRRADRMTALPWSHKPLPRRYIFIDSCSGWGGNTGNPEVFWEEYRTLRHLGVNGLMYDSWPGYEEMVRRGEGIAAGFNRVRGQNLGQNGWPRYSGYMIPDFYPDRWEEAFEKGHGCPHHPAHAGFAADVRAAVIEMMADLREQPFDEVWFRTVDEIGSYFDRSAERKAHQGSCPHCRKAFHDYLRAFGLTLADFGVASWDDIRSTFGYWTDPWQPRAAESEVATTAATDTRAADIDAVLAVDRAGDAVTAVTGLLDGEDADDAAARAGDGGREPPLPPWGWARLRYYSMRFNNDASARLFTPLRDALTEQNAAKRRALAAGDVDAPAARQPWVYAYALRGNTFLMRGHSLDFFDWYRHADNAFEYETSNRDPRVWQWDGYLCEVGRAHQERMGTRFSIMIKPGRGAVIQRTLAAVSRNVRRVYWYTYGPDWHHPDTYARSEDRLVKMSRVVHMIGENEDALYDADRVEPARVAVVRPRTSQIFDTTAAWENGKWIYQALTHAHIPVDALDEGYLLTEDLSRYRAIYISGSHLRADVADKLRQWVHDGGLLYTSGGGLARDESDRPLEALQPVLGLPRRDAVTLWSRVRGYGATRLAGYEPIAEPPPGSAAVTVNDALFPEGLDLIVGREVLAPVAEAEILARYGDGGVAAIRHAYGKGAAVVIGFYPGLEYAADILRNDYDLAADFKRAKRAVITAPALAAGVRPPVQASHPLIETALLRHPDGRETIILMNWTWTHASRTETVPHPRVTLTWHSAAGATSVHSAWLDQSFPVEQVADGGWQVVLPIVGDGDILRLETVPDG